MNSPELTAEIQNITDMETVKEKLLVTVTQTDWQKEPICLCYWSI